MDKEGKVVEAFLVHHTQIDPILKVMCNRAGFLRDVIPVFKLVPLDFILGVVRNNHNSTKHTYSSVHLRIEG